MHKERQRETDRENRARRANQRQKQRLGNKGEEKQTQRVKERRREGIKGGRDKGSQGKKGWGGKSEQAGEGEGRHGPGWGDPDPSTGAQPAHRPAELRFQGLQRPDSVTNACVTYYEESLKKPSFIAVYVM